jgi:UDP-glucose 4-epimerase
MMKQILITGLQSYVGNKVGTYLEEKGYMITYISLRDDAWKKFDFKPYDVIFHVAGLAHVKSKKKAEQDYYKINHHLTKELALKCKEAGLKHFVFMSSMMVFNPRTKKIDSHTKPNPITVYGKSKLAAEKELLELQDYQFKVTILRPPMIYGAHSRGNFEKLRLFALQINVFPKFNNKRSMLYVDNLSIIIKHVIENDLTGLFHPHNLEYSSTFEIVIKISSLNNQKIKYTRLFNPLIKISMFHPLINKVFGDFWYSFYDIKPMGLISLNQSLKEIEQAYEN